MSVWILLLFWCAIGGAFGYAIGDGRGRGTTGFWLGFCLGFIGWIIVALMGPTPDEEERRADVLGAAIHEQMIHDIEDDIEVTRDCPWCAESIKPAAIICRFCGREVDPIQVPATPTNTSRPSSGEFDVIYETSSWSAAQRSKFAAQLVSKHIPHEWIDTDVRVDRQYEQMVDSLLAI